MSEGQVDLSQRGELVEGGQRRRRDACAAEVQARQPCEAGEALAGWVAHLRACQAQKSERAQPLQLPRPGPVIHSCVGEV